MSKYVVGKEVKTNEDVLEKVKFVLESIDKLPKKDLGSKDIKDVEDIKNRKKHPAIILGVFDGEMTTSMIGGYNLDLENVFIHLSENTVMDTILKKSMLSKILNMTTGKIELKNNSDNFPGVQ